MKDEYKILIDNIPIQDYGTPNTRTTYPKSYTINWYFLHW